MQFLDYILLALIAFAAALAVRKIIRDRRAGKCCGNCAGCTTHCSAARAARGDASCTVHSDAACAAHVGASDAVRCAKKQTTTPDKPDAVRFRSTKL